MRNVMLDLETLGTVGGNTILSIGVITFEGDASFYAGISTRSSDIEGFTTNPDTAKWWAQQDKEAREAAFSGKTSIRKALYDLNEWAMALVGGRKEDIVWWSNGASMDVAMLDSAYFIVNMETIHAVEDAKIDSPIYYKNTRCYRTLVALYPSLYDEAKRVVPRSVMQHHALEDAKWQASIASYILTRLKDIKDIEGSEYD